MRKALICTIFAIALFASSIKVNAFPFPLIPIGVKAGVGGMMMLYSTATGMYIISAATAAYYAGAATFTILGTVYIVSDYVDCDGKPLQDNE